MTTLKKHKKPNFVWKIGPKLGKEAEKIRDDIPYRGWVTIVIIVNLFLIAAVFLLKNRLPPEIPIFYGRPYGEEQIGNVHLLALPSIVSLGITFLNILIGLFIKDEFLVKILTLTGVGATFFSFVTTIKIIFLVGNI